MGDNKLEFIGVTKRYKDTIAINDFSTEMTSGIYGLLGPNGSGKSTLMKCIADVIRPTSGSILFNGKRIYEIGEDYRAVLGYMPQDIGFYPNFNGIQMLEYFATLKGISLTNKDAESALSEVNLLDAKFKKIKEYSGGMKRRLAIAVTMLNSPDIIIFDEPTAGLDPEERLRFKRLLLSLSSTKIIIIATHIISDLEALCDEIIFIKKGKLIRKQKVDKSIRTQQIEGLEEQYIEIFGESYEEK